MSVTEPMPMTVGFMPLLDCGLLVAAAEKGFAEAEGIELRLARETSWANIRDRVAVGHFDAAHMLGPMVVAETLGAGQINVPLMAPAALGRGGNAITLSRNLWKQVALAGAGLGDAPATVATALARVVSTRQARGDAPLVLAMVFPFSCHNYQLRGWLSAAGLDPSRDVRLVVLPPPLLVDALRSGQVDGFCVGEPWSSLAVDSGAGVIAAVVTDIWPAAPEKVLGMRADYVERHPQRVRALVRAIEAASHWLRHPAHRQELAELLAEPHYVGVPARLLRSALEGEIRLAASAAPVKRPGFIDLSSDEATVPMPQHAGWYCEQMQRGGQIVADVSQQARALASCRRDLHAAALGAPVSRGGQRS